MCRKWFACLGLALGVLLVLATAQPAYAQRKAPVRPPEIQKLYDDKPTIELVTMGIGSLIWERHGHIALCVIWGDQRDACYNYGVGNFQNPLSMTWGFFRGTNSFWVAKQPRRQMLWIYEHADRTIWAQPIPLTKEQKEQVIAKLEFDILEENKHYSYDHFWDNCTTRVRDILDKATDGALSKMTEKTDGRTYRDLAREGFFGLDSTVPLLITDIAMGRVTDAVPSYWERMFLPDYLRDAVRVRWGIEPIVEYQRMGPPPEKDGPSGRLKMFFVICALTLPAILTRLFGKLQRTGMALVVVPASIVGLVFWFLAIISPLPYVRWQETCLILMPFDLLLLFLPMDKRVKYAKGRVVMLGLVAALMVVNVLKAPNWMLLPWALVPAAIVGFWPERWTGKLLGRT